MAQNRIAREVYYRGRVQGVGFRFNARQIAKRFEVQGYVRNLEDGRDYLVACGTPAEVEAFITANAPRT